MYSHFNSRGTVAKVYLRADSGNAWRWMACLTYPREKGYGSQAHARLETHSRAFILHILL